MASYEIDEARMVVPDGWEDRTINSLEYDDAGGVLKVLMSRHRTADRPLAKMVDDIVVDLRRRLAAFELIERRAVELDGEDVVEVHSSFRDGQNHVDQRQFWFISNGKCVALGVLHARPKDGEGDERSAQAAAIFEQIRETIRLRDPAEQDIEAPSPLGPVVGGTGAGEAS